MRLNWNTISDATRKRNPELFGHGLGSVQTSKPKRSGRRKSQAKDADKEGGAFRVVISLIALRRVRLDPDNNVSSFKHVQDSIADSIGLDDGDERITWQYSQCHTEGEEGVMVRIEVNGADQR